MKTSQRRTVAWFVALAVLMLLIAAAGLAAGRRAGPGATATCHWKAVIVCRNTGMATRCAQVLTACFPDKTP